MYDKTLFLVDRDATVGGVAAAFSDLAALGAHDVEVHQLDTPALELPLKRIAALGRESKASLVAVGVANPTALRELGVSGRAAVADLPLIYLGVSAPAGELLPEQSRILGHVLALGDYSVRSSCVAACLTRIAGGGARVVTLLHTPDSALAARCVRPAVGELGRIDTDWVDRLKEMLFSAGVEEVRFLSPVPGAAGLLEHDPAVSLILVGHTCNADISAAYGMAASRRIVHREDAPALLLTAESCAAIGGKRGRKRGAA